jgi:hypothetical protein
MIPTRVKLITKPMFSHHTIYLSKWIIHRFPCFLFGGNKEEIRILYNSKCCPGMHPPQYMSLNRRNLEHFDTKWWNGKKTLRKGVIILQLNMCGANLLHRWWPWITANWETIAGNSERLTSLSKVTQLVCGGYHMSINVMKKHSLLSWQDALILAWHGVLHQKS